MNEWILLLLSIPIHELGHYSAFRLFKHKPTVKIKWWGIEIDANVMEQTTWLQALFISYCGPGLGLAFLCIMDVSALIIIAHIFMSIIDFNNIVQLMSLDKLCRKKTIKDIRISEARKTLEQYGVT